jgi:hypothetical protein
MGFESAFLPYQEKLNLVGTVKEDIARISEQARTAAITR